MVVSPDEITSTFEQNRTTVSQAEPKSKPPDLDVVFIENLFDPDPNDTTYESTFVYLIREHGRQRIEVDHHVLGLFAIEVWRDALRETGFEIHEHDYDEAQRVSTTFACVRP